jgi:hypothetical protein
MIKLLTITVLSLCLIMSVGIYGIAGADDMKEQGEEMINVSKTLEQDNDAAVEDGEKIIDEAEMQKEDAEMVEKHEMADDTLKAMDKN